MSKLIKPCKHVPNWGTLCVADDATGIVDVWCAECGSSGSVLVMASSIDWGED